MSSSNLWQTSISNPPLQAISAGNYLVYINTGNALVFVDILTGVKYEPDFQHVSNPQYLGSDQGIVVVVDLDNNGHYRILAFSATASVQACINQQYPTPLWTVEPSATGPIPEQSPLNIIGYEVYEGVFAAVYSIETSSGNDYYITALSIQSGEPVWHKNSALKYIQVQQPSGNTSPVNLGPYLCVGDGSFFMVVSGTLFAYNRHFGDRRFPRAAGKMVDPPAQTTLSQVFPILYGNKTIVAVGEDNTVKGLSSDIGALLWSFPQTPSSTSKWRTACLSPDGTMTAVYSDQGEVQLLEVATGNTLWTSNQQLTGVTSVSGVQAVLTPVELQILPEGSGSVFTINANTASPQVSSTPFQQGASGTSPVMINGSVVTCSEGSGGAGYNLVAQPIALDADAAWFDGTGNSIAFQFPTGSNALNFGTGDYTVEFWMRSSVGGEVFSTTTGGNVKLRMNISQGGRLSLAVSNGSASDLQYSASVTGTTNATDGKWHHVAAVKQAGTTTFYLDGLQVPSEKVQLYNNTRYYNDHYQLVKSTLGSGPTHLLKQLPVDSTLAPAISLEGQTGFTISPQSDDAASAYSGLLREFRIWQNAASAELIQNRMYKILGPHGCDHSGTTKNTLTGSEPRLVVNVHLDKNYGVYPAALLAPGYNPQNGTLINDVSTTDVLEGTFTNACSCPTDLVLQLDGFPYLLDKRQRQWPFEEFWAVRAEHAVTTRAVMSSGGIVCFGANNGLYGIRKHDGKAQWNISLDTGFSNPVATDMGFLVLSDGQVLLIDPMTGQVISLGTGARSYTAQAAFASNHDVDALGDYIVFANAKDTNGNRGIAFIKDLAATTTPVKSTLRNEASHIRLIGSTVYWCDTDTSGSSPVYSIMAYDLESSTQVFATPVAATSPLFAVNGQYLYCLTTAGLTIIDAASGNQTGTPNAAITAISGIAIDTAGNHLIVTQNGTGTTPGAVMGLKPGTLNVNWTQPLSGNPVNAPVIEGRNAFCTWDTNIAAFDTTSGNLRGSFQVTNPILGPALMDKTTAYFACADGAAGTEIDGALHQVVFGDTNVLEFDGKSYVQVTNTATSGVPIQQFTELDPANCCVEAWVNLENLSAAAGIVSLQATQNSVTADMHLYIDASQNIHFRATTQTSAGITGFDSVSAAGQLVAAQQWCHIAVNVRTRNSGTNVALFVNGKPHTVNTTALSLPASGSNTAGMTAYLGATGVATGTPANPINGLIGYVRIWNAYQNVPQIMDRMHTQLIGTEADLLADWNFDLLEVHDSTGNVSAQNGFDITMQTLSGGTAPQYILNELNFTKPNYPFLTYVGENNGQNNSGSTTYQKYILTINAHKADGSPLADEQLLLWYADGGNGQEVYLKASDDTPDPTGGTKLTPVSGVSEESITNPTNCYTATTDQNGQAVIYVDSPQSAQGPGFDVYASFLPHHERFHVNAIIDRQSLKVAPPPTINAQAELISDYHYERGGTIDQNRQKGVFRAILRAENPDKSPRAGEMVVVYSDIPQKITVDGTDYNINSFNGAVFYTDGTGEVMVDADATDLKGYVLQVWTGFMHRNDRVKFPVADAPHKRLGKVSATDLTSTYNTAWTASGPITSPHLVPKQYNSSAGQVATSFHHLMSASHAGPGGDGDTVSATPGGSVNPKPAMQQPIGMAMPDKISALRTLTYIDRKKTMDFDAMKDSVQKAASAAATPVADAQGVQMVFDATGNSFQLVYLDAAGVQKARQGKGTTVHHQEVELGGFFSDLFSDIEDVVEDAVKAFEDLVKKAESLVLDLTNDIEAAIVGVLNDLGPIGHLLADGIEKVMDVVDKVIHFIEVLINTMIDFLMLLFEWKHIVNTHNMLKTGMIQPGLNYIQTFLQGGAFVTTLTNAFSGLGQTAVPTGSGLLSTSVGDVKSKYQNQDYGSQAHSVKSKSLLNKTKTHAGSMRTASATLPPTTPSQGPGSTVTSFTQNANDQLSGFNFNGSLDPLTGIVQSINTLIGGAGISTLMTDLSDPLQACLPSAQYDALLALLSQEIDIPFISALYEFLTGDPLTIIDLFSLATAVPVFVVYEALYDGNYIDKDYSSFPAHLPSSGTHSTLLSVASTPPQLPSPSDVKLAAVLFVVFSELSIICDLVSEYLTYRTMQAAGEEAAQEDPVTRMFNSASAVCNIIVAMCNLGISTNLADALDVDTSQPGSTLPASYASDLKVFADVFFGVSVLFSVASMLPLERLFSKVPGKAKEMATLTGIAMTPVALIMGVWAIVKVIEMDVHHADEVGDTSPFEQSLTKRLELYYISTGLSSVYMLGWAIKTIAKSKNASTLYLATCIVRAVLNEAATIVKAVGELEYGMNEHQPTT